MQMTKSKQRAVAILIVLGSIALLCATWNMPEDLAKHG